MRVVHIIQRYPPAIGGTETWCRNLNRYLVNQGIVVEVATINLFNIEEFFIRYSDEQKSVRLGAFDFDEGVWVRRFRLWSFAGKGFSSCFINFLLGKVNLCKTEIGAIFKHSPHSFQMYRNLGNVIHNADIVHLHTLPYFHNLIGFLIAKMSGKKIIITPHFHPGHKHYERKLFYRLMNRCDAVLAMTGWEKEYLIKKGVSASNIYVIGNSIDTRTLIARDECEKYARHVAEKYALSPHAKKIIFIGRKELYKGIPSLIEAAEQLVNELNEEIAIFFVGPDSVEFRKRYGNVLRFDKLKIIDFGLVTDADKEKLIAFSDVLVLASEFEAFGIVFLEAWKYKKPVIGSNRGAIPDVIKDAGLCVRYGDSIDLKDKLKKILCDSEVSRRYGEMGKQRLDKEFSLEQIGKKVLHVYRNLLPRRKKIVIVSNLFPPYAKGGAEIVAYQQARVLKKMGFDVNIFTGMWNEKLPRFYVQDVIDEFKVRRINLYDIDFDWHSVNFNKKEVVAEFNKLLFYCAPDLVHFHNISALCMKIIGECYIKKIPTVMTIHDYWAVCPKNILITGERALCDKKTFKCEYCNDYFFIQNDEAFTFNERNKIFMEHLNLLDMIVSPSEYLLNRFISCGLDPQRGKVVNNGIDFSRFNRIKKNKSKKLRIGFVGQIMEHKGLEILLKSVSLLNKDEKAKISLNIIGTGEDFFVQFCKNLTRELGLLDVVRFVGMVSNDKIPIVLSRIDVLVVPSLWPENSPVTIMEALASGIPVLASRVGGIPELVEDGVNGFLYAHNKPYELVDSIKRFINQPQFILKMRDACFKKAGMYALDKQVKIIADHYDNLINWDNK